MFHPPGRPSAVQPRAPAAGLTPGPAARHHSSGDDATITTTIETGALDKALRALKLSRMPDTIEARLARARAGGDHYEGQFGGQIAASGG